MFNQGQRVKLAGYGSYTFRTDGRAGDGDVLGTVMLADPARLEAGYGLLVRIDDALMDRESYPAFVDGQTGVEYDFSFNATGCYIEGEQPVLEAVE